MSAVGAQHGLSTSSFKVCRCNKVLQVNATSDGHSQGDKKETGCRGCTMVRLWMETGEELRCCYEAGFGLHIPNGGGVEITPFWFGLRAVLRKSKRARHGCGEQAGCPWA